MQVFEIERILESINNLKLTKNQYKKLINVLLQAQVNEHALMIDIADSIKKNDKYIFDGQQDIALEPILMEDMSNTTILMEILLPIIEKNIPRKVLELFSEKQVIDIYNQIIEAEISDINDISKKINEMFSAGDISIPVQGLRNKEVDLQIIRNGVLAPILFKQISNPSSRTKLKELITDFPISDSLTDILPRLSMQMTIGDI